MFPRFVIVVIFSFIFRSKGICQDSDTQYFKLDGSINSIPGIVRLRPIFDTMMYPPELRDLKSAVQNGRFELSAPIRNPQGFDVIFLDSAKGGAYFPVKVFLEPGDQTIVCDVNTKKISGLDNVTMREYKNDFTPMFKQVRKSISDIYKYSDSVRKAYQGNAPKEIEAHIAEQQDNFYRQSNQILLGYTRTHPGSYVAFWHLAQLMPFGYEPIYDTIYENFSSDIKNAYAGKVLAKKLMGAGVIKIGVHLPAIQVGTLENKNIKPLFIKRKFNYTLIDFWYSHCGPCIAQFPKLKKIYKEHHGAGFEIVGISVDKGKDEQDWRKAIKKYRLPWTQCWDVNGSEATKLSITAYPSNLLMDSLGNIIAKNIEPEQLEIILNQKMRKGPNKVTR